MLLPRARLLIATFWVGTLWATGFIVVPTLFATLADRILAGTIAGSLFRVVAWLSISCAAALIALLFQAMRSEDQKPSKTVFYLIAGMVACTVAYFGMQPHMAELRVVLHSVADPALVTEAAKQFGIMHGIATGIYVVQSLLGATLILKLR
jgi:Domain of unknown function (DUF4149)